MNDSFYEPADLHVPSSRPLRRLVLLAGSLALVISVGAFIAIRRPGTTVLPVQSSAQSVSSPPVISDTALYSPLNHFAEGDNLASQPTQIDQATAKCMASRGWSYTAVTTAPPADPPTIGALRSYRESVGYGIATSTYEADVAAVQAANLKYVNTLSSSARDRYYADLGGGLPQLNTPANPQSCQALAMQEVRQGLPYFDDSVRPAIGQAQRSIINSATFLTAMSAWRSCMGAQGYQVNTLEDPRSQIDAAFRASNGSTLASIKAREVTMATADFTCQMSSVIPARQALELQEVASLKAQFPQYANR